MEERKSLYHYNPVKTIDGVEHKYILRHTPKADQRALLYEPFFIEAYRDWETDRKSTRLNSSHSAKSRMPSSA